MYSGLLVEVDGGLGAVVEICSSGEMLGAPAPVLSGYFCLEMVRSAPLLGEPAGLGEYKYPLLVRKGSGDKILLAAIYHGLPQAILDAAGCIRRVQPTVLVRELVQELVDHPDQYCLGGTYARIKGHGDKLRSAGFFGDDLGDADLFRSLLSQISPYRATLRTVQGNYEALSIGSGGELNFYFHGLQSLERLDQVLAFLSSRGFLRWASDPDTSVEG